MVTKSAATVITDDRGEDELLLLMSLLCVDS